MGIFTGRQVQVGIALEDTRGTAESAADYTYPQMNYTIKDTEANTAYREDAHGTNIKNSGKDTLTVEGDGTLGGNIYVKGIVYFLALAFGKLPTTTDTVGDTAAKKHAFTLLDNNEHATATIFVDEPNLGDVKFAGAMPDSFTINWAAGEYPTIEIPIKSKSSVASTHTLTVVDESMFLPDMASLKIAANLAGLAVATPARDIKSFSLTFTKNLAPQQTMSSGKTYQEIFNGDFEVTGSITKLYRDSTYRAKALNDTVNALEFAFSDSVNKAGTTTPTSMKFTIAEAAFEGHEPAYGLSDISEETINFTMIRRPTSSKSAAITAEVVNKFTYA